MILKAFLRMKYKNAINIRKSMQNMRWVEISIKFKAVAKKLLQTFYKKVTLSQETPCFGSFLAQYSSKSLGNPGKNS